MPRTGWRKSESDRRLPDLVSVGLLMKVFPAEVVDAVITECGRTEKRRRSLPARSMAYFAMGMALHSEGSYEDVLAMISDGLARPLVAVRPRKPVGDHRQHVLIRALGVQRHPHREVRHRAGRQRPPPLLRPATEPRPWPAAGRSGANRQLPHLLRQWAADKGFSKKSWTSWGTYVDLRKRAPPRNVPHG